MERRRLDANLFCFGLGYSASHYIAEFGARFDRIAGTVRTREKAAAIAAAGIGGHKVEAFVFDGRRPTPEVTAAVTDASAVLISVPPRQRRRSGSGPFRRHACGRAAPADRSSIFRPSASTAITAAHGSTRRRPRRRCRGRSRERLEAEQAWSALGGRAGKAVALLRLSGIYGPGQNALLQVARGSAKRIDKPGQVFNRIHVADIAQAIDAAFARRADGVFNVTDDEPTRRARRSPSRPSCSACAPPPEIPFAEAAKGMTPMALSFYGESKRVRNARLKGELGVALRYPTYREGLRALFEAGERR